jgi:ubiquinone/menaquinone biosynthesis C-methylase UbiE
MSQASLPTAASTRPLDVEATVRQRYSAASQQRAPDLCCPVNYDARYLDALPPELIERDYGCGDPSRHLRAGETVLDLGSGGGKICYIAAQVVGPAGRVIGVDCNDDMLALARKYQRQIGDRLGYHNVEFRKGQIQDLALDLERFGRYLRDEPVCDAAQWLRASEHAQSLRQTEPMIADDSIDVVVSNCVLNLVRRSERIQLFEEMYRVLRPGGRVVISDITSDEPVPEQLQQDPALWSGCISGAFVELDFVEAFAAAGFQAMQIVDRQAEPWATLAGIEFRSLTIEAFRPIAAPDRNNGQAVIYRGPWKSVTDDEGRTLERGVRTPVNQQAFETYMRPPYADAMIGVPARGEVSAAPDRCCGPSDCGPS